MVHWKNSKTVCSPGEEDDAASSQNQQHARPQLARSQRRRCRQTTAERQGKDQARALQGDQQEGGASPGSVRGRL